MVVTFIAKLELLKLDYTEGVPLLSEDHRTFRVEGRAPCAVKSISGRIRGEIRHRRQR